MKKTTLLLLSMLFAFFSAAAQRVDSTAVVEQEDGEYLAPVFAPWGMWGYGQWHGLWWGMSPVVYAREGLSAQLQLSAISGLGSEATRGVGWGQELVLNYRKRLNSRWDWGMSARAANYTWDAFAHRRIDLSAFMRYKATDWLNLIAYASQRVTSSPQAMPMFGAYPYYLPPPATRIGAAAEIKLGEHAVLSVNVDWVKYETEDLAPLMERPRYHRNYSY